VTAIRAILASETRKLSLRL